MNERVIPKQYASLPSLLAPPSIVVAIPVCNERDCIAACLDALAAQTGLAPGAFGIVVFLNNCSGGTAELVESYPRMPWPLKIIERDDPNASAGWARRIAMDAAADWITEAGSRDGVLFTTDADSCVGTDWVVRNLRAIADGADAVAGRISLDPADAARLPAALHARGRLESRYESLLTEIGARLDPEPGNAWPCHWSKSGATIAVRWSVYRQVGGMPDMPAGEDRAFIDAVRAHDLVVRHDPEIEVVTSGRLEGRACGGVADTIKLRCDVPESPCDDRLEKVHRLLGRLFWRRRLRRLFSDRTLGQSWRWAPLLSIDRKKAEQCAEAHWFGQAYSAIASASPRLAYRPLRPAQLPTQIRRAEALVALLRALDRRRKRDASTRACEPALTEEPKPSPT